MPESLIDHIRRHTTLDRNDATQATVEWLRKHAGSLGFVEGIWLRLAARIIQAEVDREENRTDAAQASDCRTRRRCPIPDDPCGPGGARPYCWEEGR